MKHFKVNAFEIAIGIILGIFFLWGILEWALRQMGL